MSQQFFRHGISTARSRPGLAGLVYGMNLIVGVILTVPIYIALSSVTGASGFASELTGQFDITLWTDIMEDAGPAFQALIGQLIWIIPVYFLWKMASSVGIIHTLDTKGARSFWHGVGEYTGRAVLLGLVFLVPLIVLGVGIAIAVVVLTIIFPGEAGMYWIYVVFLPVSLVLGAALIDMMHDYARMELVIGGRPVMESWLSGIRWPFRYGGADALYASWFVIAGVILIVPTVIDLNMGGIWTVFLVQQIVLFLRATASVGWFGSEVLFYQTATAAVEPVLADVEMGVGQPVDGSGEVG